MPVKSHLKIVFRGVFLNSPEIWSFSTKWSRNVVAGGDAGTADIDQSAVTAALSAFMGTALFQNNTSCTEWRAYQIGTDGLTEGNPLLVDISATPVTGTGSTRNYPTDVALCITTVADNRGHARFGRFYLPGPHSGLDNGRRIPLSDVTAMSDACTDFLKGVSDSIDLPGTIDSSEMLNISNDSASTAQTVDHIKVGRVFDRISRRRNALDEDYFEGGHIDW